MATCRNRRERIVVILLPGEARKHAPLNLGGAHTTSLAELVALLEEALGVRAVLDRQPAQPGDVPLTSADVTHAKEVLGYAPRTPIRAGLKRFAEWIRGEGQNWV